MVPHEPPKNGGVGMMTSFGEGILGHAAANWPRLLSAISNGGTLYYLQYPRTQEEVGRFRAAREAAAGDRAVHFG